MPGDESTNASREDSNQWTTILMEGFEGTWPPGSPSTPKWTVTEQGAGVRLWKNDDY